MNASILVVFDFETSGLSHIVDRIVQIGGKAYDYRTLEPISPDDGGEFMLYSRPDNLDDLDFSNQAFKINGVTRDMLENAPEERSAWLKFVSWVNGFNPQKSQRGAPYAGGKNIIGFDLKWVDVLNIKHSPKKEKTLLFNNRRVFDLEDDIERWFVGTNDLPNQKMDTLRAHFGFPPSPQHCALRDCREEGDLLVHFLKLYRTLKARVRKDGNPMIQFKGAFAK